MRVSPIYSLLGLWCTHTITKCGALSDSGSSSSSSSFATADERHSAVEHKSIADSTCTNNNDERTNFNVRMEYSIMNGRSALRDLSEVQHADLFRQQQLNDDENGSSKLAKVLHLIQVVKALDAAHDVLLGTSMQNVEEAEYAATHRGQTSWAEDHPLDEMDNFVHSLIHRLEGANVGEGGHTGYANAKYWAAGGPKYCEVLPTRNHPVYQAMCRVIDDNEFFASELSADDRRIIVPNMEVAHTIIAGGGEVLLRVVRVEPGSWDLIGLINLWQREASTDDGSHSLLRVLWRLHELELELMKIWVAKGRRVPMLPHQLLELLSNYKNTNDHK